MNQLYVIFFSNHVLVLFLQVPHTPRLVSPITRCQQVPRVARRYRRIRNSVRTERGMIRRPSASGRLVLLQALVLLPRFVLLTLAHLLTPIQTSMSQSSQSDIPNTDYILTIYIAVYHEFIF